ncbi:MAG: tetratricopeptide repeat protein, partial [Gemmatimonadaceae bacterium]
RELCRYLALAPSAPDVAEVRERIAALAPPATRIRSDQAEVHFRNGLELFDRGRLREAEAAFTAVVREEPNWSDAYYNRALVHVRQSEPEEAAADLERYLEKDANAADRATVRQRIAELRRRDRAPSTAFVRGLLVPGMGQMYTGRPALGALVIAGVAGAAAYALQPKEVTRTAQFQDPFGNPYEEVYTDKEYPNVAVGVGAAAAITLVGALESYLYAKRGQKQLAAAPHAELRVGTARGLGQGSTPMELRLGIRIAGTP